MYELLKKEDESWVALIKFWHFLTLSQLQDKTLVDDFLALI